MITIKDIAKEAGYSITTVSRVLNHKGEVSPVAKARIEEIVAKYQFVPNNNAKNLKQIQNKTIGVIVKGTGNSIFTSIIREIQQLTQKTDYSLFVSYHDYMTNELDVALRVINERKPIGLLILGSNPSIYAQKFSELKVPCVLVTASAEGLPYDNISSVSTDDVAAGYFIVKKLQEMGHQHIGVLGASLHYSKSASDRMAGYKRAIEEAGEIYDPDKYYQESEFTYIDAIQQVQTLVRKAPEITAIFAMADVAAIGAIRGLRDMGIRVPEDISVVGFDGLEEGEYFIPRLTTICQRDKVISEMSFNILIDQIENGIHPIREIIPFDFKEGESLTERM